MAFAPPKLPSKDQLLRELQRTIDSVKQIQAKGGNRKLKFEDYIQTGKPMNYQTIRNSSASKSPSRRPISRTPPWKKINTKVMKSARLGESPYSSVERT